MPWRSITSRGRYCVVSVTTAILDIAGAAYPVLGRTSAERARNVERGSRGRRRVDNRPHEEGTNHEVPRDHLQRRDRCTRTPRRRTSRRRSQAHGEFGEAAGEGRRVRWAARACSRPPTATTVRVRDGERMLTDGPYAETKEQLGGYYLLECKDLDDGAQLGGADPGGASPARVEVRPIMDYEGDGAAADAADLTGRRRPRRPPVPARVGTGGRRSSPASSATSTAPRRRCRTRS